MGIGGMLVGGECDGNIIKKFFECLNTCGKLKFDGFLAVTHNICKQNAQNRERERNPRN